MIKKILRKLLPSSSILMYHLLLAKFARFIYRDPSSKIVVIGVTGTNGKSSTVQFIAQILTALGSKVGYTTTAGFNIGGRDIENKLKMTMPGRFLLQKLIRQMVNEGCEYAIIETSSQGIAQYRHIGIRYDVAVFTNLTPEHIESHGSFKRYKEAKGQLFDHLSAYPHKKINGKKIDRIIVTNVDDQYSDYFSSFASDDVVKYSFSGEESEFRVSDYEVIASGAKFKVNGIEFEVPLIGEYQHKNVLAAISTVMSLGFDLSEISAIVRDLKPVPGRLQLIERGQPFTVVLDYAYEPYALEALYRSVLQLPHGRVIGLHGSAGGGRDVARRPQIGAFAKSHNEISIITNEDPYDEDPELIIKDIVRGFEDAEGKSELFVFSDRSQAIKEAVSMAKGGDLVLITGKGSEPVMAVKDGKTIPWSDEEEIVKSLKDIGYGENG